MADTVFVDGNTVLLAAWCNDVNRTQYTLLGNPSTISALLTAVLAGTGNAPLILSGASGGQIVFPASQNASTNANTLDDYEEGSWTPAIGFATAGDQSIVYSNQTGRYHKIGKLVTLSFAITTSTFTHTTASGNLTMTGNPFTCETVSGHTTQNALGTFRGITKASFTQFGVSIASAATNILFTAAGSAQTNGNLTTADLPTGGTVVLAGTLQYMASA